jgi:glycosyltransferase involved in cell wall biosynthesis
MSGLWCLSRPQVDRLRALRGRGGPSVSFLRFGVDEHFYSAAEYPDRPLVLSVGGDRDRDTATLFAALGRVRAEQPAARIVVQTSSTLPPPDGVEVFRHLRHTELRELYREASVVVLATRPNLHVSGMTVSLEAMATGRPVVVTHTPGMDDYVDAEVGVPVTLGDHEALASGVIGLLGRPDDARAMGERGRARVEQRHTSAGMARDLAAIIGGRA